MTARDRGHQECSRLRRWPAVAAAALLSLCGCGLEAPQAPSFETTLYVPLEQETYTGQQMAAGLQAVAGDTTTPGPLTIQISEEIDPVMLEGEISAGVEERTYTADLAAIQFVPPAVAPVSLPPADVLPEGIPAPGQVLPVAAFSFGPRTVELETSGGFEEAAFASGTMRLVVTNGLPIPIGGTQPGQVVRVRLLDRSQVPPAVVLEWILPEAVPSGGSAEVEHDLAGLSVPGSLALEVSGWSAGSGGVAVDFSASVGLALAIDFADARLERLVGPLPALSAVTEGRIEFAESCTITEAVVSEGRLACQLQSYLPVAATLALELPQLLVGGEPLRIVTHVGARETAQVDVDVAGAEMRSGEAGDWPLRLTVTTEPTQETATAALGPAATGTLQAADLKLASIRGVMDHIAVAIARVETPIEFPAGTEGVEFTAARAEILVRNRAAVTTEAALELEAQAGGDTVRVPITATLAAGTIDSPAETRITLDETNSEIAALLRLRPAAVVLGGSITIGDGLSEGSVQAGDYLDGRFTVLAPMRLVLETAHQQGDPFKVELDEDLRDHVTENLLGMSVDAQVENHFPTAVAIQFHFARDEGALFVTDDLILAAEPIACAQVDPATGRVSASSTNNITLSVAGGDIDLFTEGRLYGGLEITLLGDGEQAIEIWSTDYVKVKGVAAFRCRIE